VDKPRHNWQKVTEAWIYSWLRAKNIDEQTNKYTRIRLRSRVLWEYSIGGVVVSYSPNADSFIARNAADFSTDPLPQITVIQDFPRSLA
jgi:hypothetical protein